MFSRICALTASKLGPDPAPAPAPFPLGNGSDCTCSRNTASSIELDIAFDKSDLSMLLISSSFSLSTNNAMVNEEQPAARRPFVLQAFQVVCGRFQPRAQVLVHCMNMTQSTW